MALEVVSKRVIGSQLWILKKASWLQCQGQIDRRLGWLERAEKQKHGNTERKALTVGQDKGDGGADSRDGTDIKYILGSITYETLNEFSVGQGKEAVIGDLKSLSGITN